MLSFCCWRNCRSPGPYADDEALYEHLNSAHNCPPGPGSDGSFCCEWEGCRGRRATFKGHLNRAHHLITHTAYKPFVCDCGAKFNRKHHLVKHVETVHAQAFGRAEESEDTDDESTDEEAAGQSVDGLTDEEKLVKPDEGSRYEESLELLERKTCHRTSVSDGHRSLRSQKKVAHPKPDASKKRARAVSDHAEVTKNKKKSKASNMATTSSGSATLLTVEDWSDDDPAALPPPAHDRGNDSDASADSLLLIVRLLTAERRLAGLEARLAQRGQ